jgi:hypothetical protein
MTGPEHYRRAENILDDLRRSECRMSDRPSKDAVNRWLAEAQVHATLALAAATALTGPLATEYASCDANYQAWAEVASEIPAGGES